MANNRCGDSQVGPKARDGEGLAGFALSIKFIFLKRTLIAREQKRGIGPASADHEFVSPLISSREIESRDVAQTIV
jgi:hypothetical protein